MGDGDWTWEHSERAAAGLETLDTRQTAAGARQTRRGDRRRVPDPPDFAKPLTGVGPWHSLRIGDYRALVRFDRSASVMQVGAVGHRSTIYDEVP